MKKKLKHIVLYPILGFFLVSLSFAVTYAQDGSKAVPAFEVTQCDTLHLQLEEFTGDRYTWDIYSDPDGNFAINQGDMEAAVYFENQMYEGASVRVLNLPPGTYFLRVMVWDEVQCTNNLMVFKMDVIPTPPPEVFGDSLCVGDVPNVRVVFTGHGPWDFTYAYFDGVNYVNGIGHADESDIIVPILDPLPVGETKFWVMEVTDACTVISYEQLAPEDRPGTGILIYKKPEKKPIYVKDTE